MMQNSFLIYDDIPSGPVALLTFSLFNMSVTSDWVITICGNEILVLFQSRCFVLI